MATRSLPSPDAALAVLNDNKPKIQEAGGTRAYVGWQFENDWITHQRAIVVQTQAANVPTVRNALPVKLGGFPVEVRADPRPKKKKPLNSSAETILSLSPAALVREEYSTPVFPGEIDFDPPAMPAEMTVMKRGKEHVPYVPPPDVNLDPITAPMTLILHASPEQGWVQLRPFLEKKCHELVVGIYEFTAPHIEKSILSGLDPATNITLTLDSPPEKKGKREQTVEDTRAHLAQHFKSHLSFAWALAGLGTQAPAMAFPTSYHIKVAVKDSREFWLSSGNWNTSNQPELDPSDKDAITQAKKSDRDWHVICDCAELAKVFRAYLLQDYRTAAANAEIAAVATLAARTGHDIGEPVESDLSAAPRGPKQLFDAKKITGAIKIKPLLTPDDYRRPVLDLIKSARSRFYMQTQYIHPANDKNDATTPTHTSLINAVIDLIKSEKVDVKLITSEWQSKGWLEKLQDAGLDAANYLMIQPKVHNKGIVVDSSVVVVSSQNWSEDGTGGNRDAGLIIYNSEAARYFEDIFLHDWKNMAEKRAYGS
jgi:hypothetical protein